MKQILLLLLCLQGYTSFAQEITTIPIVTADHALVLQTDKDNRLWTVYFGDKMADTKSYTGTTKQLDFKDDNAGVYNSAYTPAGTWNLSEPAIEVIHADSNTSLDLKYVSHQTKRENDNVSVTTIKLQDPVYKLTVELFYKLWMKENVIEQWTEITNTETGPVTMQKYASANLYFTNKDFYLTSFQGEYLKEMQPYEEKLLRGMKSIDTKLGTRAMLLGTPNFMISFGQPARENEGKVLLGQLAWSGNYKLDFEVDSYKNLRLITGINPYASAYRLAVGERFKNTLFYLYHFQ